MARTPANTRQTAPRPLGAILWDTADKMRGNLERSEYKHVVLGHFCMVGLDHLGPVSPSRRHGGWPR